jgi:hypothetical protein
MCAEPILPPAILIKIGKLNQSPCANQRVRFLGGVLSAKHFDFGVSK